MSSIAVQKEDRLSRWSDRVSEWCSSILVKETRQALKSKQFIITYFLLLVCVVLWTVVGIAFGDRDYHSSDAGVFLLQGFWMILGFPLGLIIPFSAYRSLAREYEDGTIQLISITTMKPRQIVFGKFGSAILQMLVYLSVLAPCILFTYLLRGVSLHLILTGLSVCITGSLALTALGLFLAGAIRSRALGIGLSVLFVLFLGWLYIMWVALCGEMQYSNMPGFDDPDFLLGYFSIMAIAGSTAVVLIAAASAQISFFSDNRSTIIRVTMLVQQLFFWAIVVVFIQSEPYTYQMMVAMTILAAHYWLFMGFLMVGESPHISRRVQRVLPKTILSRTFGSFLMPGPGRGYLFAVLMLWSNVVVITLMAMFQKQLILDASNSRIGTSTLLAWNQGGEVTRIAFSGFVCCFYATVFLSIGFLIVRFTLHRVNRELQTGINQFISLLLGVVIIVIPTLGAIVWKAQFEPYSYNWDYTFSQHFNWYWTTIEASGRFGLDDHIITLFLLGGVCSIFIVAALAVASRELLHRPVPVPKRVVIDREESKKLHLPPGESIEDIFGEAT